MLPRFARPASPNRPSEMARKPVVIPQKAHGLPKRAFDWQTGVILATPAAPAANGSSSIDNMAALTISQTTRIDICNSLRNSRISELNWYFSPAMLSIVIPIHNEEPSILPLYDRLISVLERTGRRFEVIFVDDASNDRSFDLLANLAETDPRMKVIRLRRNFGQTAALSAGFDEAQGSVIVSLDGDLQHEPEDIPQLLAKIDEGYDIASGWRKDRVDNAITRKIPSRIANWLMARASGVNLRDFGTTFKAYRAEVIKEINLYGELHRFIPALASFYGARIAEVPIHNVPRPHGDSHYGLGRTFNVLFDILTIKFLLKYFTRPMHFFGRMGFVGVTLGGCILGGLAIHKFWGHSMLEDHGALVMAGALLLLGGLMMFSTGLLGEVLMRTYFESQGRRIYAVREIRSRKENVASA